MSEAISHIRGMHVCAGLFGEGANFDLFAGSGGKPHRVSIIFGRNGSGKTTVAEQISSIASGSESEAFFYNDCYERLDIDKSESDRIRVFDELYIKEKLFIDDDGLDAIAMLGDQASARAEIEKINEHLAKVNADLDSAMKQKAMLVSGPSSVSKLEETAKKLAKDGGWTSRRESIEGDKPSLTSRRWEAIKTSQVDVSRFSLEASFAKQLSEYEKAKASGSPISIVLNEICPGDYDEFALVEMLGKVLDKPVLTEREQRILAVVQKGGQAIIDRAREEFASAETTVCPMCQRDISSDEKKSLEKSILKVLNKEVDSFKTKLESSVFATIEGQTIPDQVSNELAVCYSRNLSKANNLISQYNKLIQQRINNLYTPISIETFDLATTLADLNGCVKDINGEIGRINEAIANSAKMKEELLRLNDQIAWIDAREKNEEWISATAKLKQVESSIDELKAAAECLISNREAQEAILRQTAIAVDVINGYLANIYFDAHRFELVPKGDKYAIRSRGCPVSLRDISTGERNILALCYFFSEGGRNRREGSQDDDPQYIVLDDPISSFDMENRIGIISLIRRRSEHILERNLSSRITVLTHDSGVVAELKHTFDDINNQMKSRQQAFTTDYLEIRSCSTQALPMKETEYSSLLKRAYEYAASEDEDANESLVIGNVLRRILEAFSTFNYGLSMEGLSRDKDLVPRFGKAAPILENMMYRLALNDESHMKERLSSLNPTMSFERYSFENKRACAQCAILILNKLDSAHVGKLLAKRGISEGDVSLNIKAWAERFTPSSKGSIVDDLNPS